MIEYELNDGILRIPEGISRIPSQAFSERSDIRKVFLPASVQFLEDECFTGCSDLEEVVIEPGLLHVGPAAFGDCTRLEKIELPETVKTIESGAFIFCEALRQLRLPARLESIGEMAFQNSGLESIVIPETVQTIEECAFFSCESLTYADVLGETTAIGRDAFGSDYQLISGYIAPGYPTFCDPAAMLLYSLLWCTCPERHKPSVSSRAEEYIRSNSQIVMERILLTNNTAAMTGLLNRNLLSDEMISVGLANALGRNLTELSALLLKMKQSSKSDEEEFDL